MTVTLRDLRMNMLVEQLPPDLRQIIELIQSATAKRDGDCLDLLQVLRVLETAHRSILQTEFQEALPDSRHALFSLLQRIEEAGEWPYISQVRLQTLLQRLSPQDLDATSGPPFPTSISPSESAPMSRPRIILASQSRARRELLTAAGFSFTTEPSYFDEDQVQTSDPVELVKTLALKKAEIVAARHPEPALIIGADSILYLHGQIYGKPDNPEDAWRRWQSMRGNVGDLYTGHAVIDTTHQRHACHYGLTRIFFAKPSDQEIQAYIETKEPLACAGCFAIDGYGSIFVERIEGCQGNVIGLSLPLLRHLFEELGYTITDFWECRPFQS